MCHYIISYNFSKSKMWVVRAQKIYNVVAKIKNNRMQRQNTIEEVLCLSAQRGYTVFYRNYPDSNVLSDIVIAPNINSNMRTWPYVLIMNTTYKTNKYNMPLLKAIGMTPTGNEQDCSVHETCMIITNRESGLMPVIEEKTHRSERTGKANRDDKR
ncbi:hypothetical protein M9H77_11875 [Catharanthus roseus]|uniref:Uncharacterized protein n=1 Tax=Catharanthus roseus TaxID=4058 RepID=A0ACC0BFT6_CATRO|nr:hypothetical protein M9H77_11875 [Catharanthus roseus]